MVEPICRVLDRPRAADRLVNPLRRPQPSALAASFTALPQQPRKTITCDRGEELSAALRVRHVRLRTGTRVYLADPHCPWRRPTNENTNGLLRQYFPNGALPQGRRPVPLERLRPHGIDDQAVDRPGWQPPAPDEPVLTGPGFDVPAHPVEPCLMRRSSRTCGTRGLAFPLIPRTADRCRPHGPRAGADGVTGTEAGTVVPAANTVLIMTAPSLRRSRPEQCSRPLHRHGARARRSLVAKGVRSTGTGTREALDRGALTRPASPVKRVGKGPVVGLRGGPRPPRRHGAPQKACTDAGREPLRLSLPRISPRPCRAPVREGSGMTRRRIGSPPALAGTGLRTLC